MSNIADKASPRKPKRRLSDMDIGEVSIVTRGANGKRFSVVKSAEYSSTREVGGITVYIDRPKGFVQEGVAPDGTKFTRTYSCDYGFLDGTTGGDGESVDCFVGDYPECPYAMIIRQHKGAHTDTCDFDEHKIMLGFRTPNEALDCYFAHVPEEFFCDAYITDVAFIKSLLHTVEKSVSRLSLAKTLAGLVEKITWDTKYVNDLPDSAFLYIAPGGEKDESGKTKPRDLRYFPVYDAEGKLDVPHVRNALARIPQAKIPDAAKEAAKSKAEQLLESTKAKDTKEVEKKITVGKVFTIPTGTALTSDTRNKLRAKLMSALSATNELIEVVSSLPIDDSADSALPPSVASAMQEIVVMLNGGQDTQDEATNAATPPSTSDVSKVEVEKIGRKISQSRYKRLMQAKELLTSVIDESTVEDKKDPELEQLREENSKLKSDAATVRKQIEDLNASLDTTKRTLEKLHEERHDKRFGLVSAGGQSVDGPRRKAVKNVEWPGIFSPK